MGMRQIRHVPRFIFSVLIVSALLAEDKFIVRVTFLFTP